MSLHSLYIMRGFLVVVAHNEFVLFLERLHFRLSPIETYVDGFRLHRVREYLCCFHTCIVHNYHVVVKYFRETEFAAFSTAW